MNPPCIALQLPKEPANPTAHISTNAPRDQSQHPRARNDYDEETACESYMNPEPGFQSGPGDSVDAD